MLAMVRGPGRKVGAESRQISAQYSDRCQVCEQLPGRRPGQTDGAFWPLRRRPDPNVSPHCPCHGMARISISLSDHLSQRRQKPRFVCTATNMPNRLVRPRPPGRSLEVACALAAENRTAARAHAGTAAPGKTEESRWLNCVITNGWYGRMVS